MPVAGSRLELEFLRHTDRYTTKKLGFAHCKHMVDCLLPLGWVWGGVQEGQWPDPDWSWGPWWTPVAAPPVPVAAALHQWSLIRAGIFKQSMGARNRVGIGLSYRPARLHRLVGWRNKFLGIDHTCDYKSLSTEKGGADQQLWGSTETPVYTLQLCISSTCVCHLPTPPSPLSS